MRQQAYQELYEHFIEMSASFGRMRDWHDTVSWRMTEANLYRDLEGEAFAIALVYKRMAQGEARKMKRRTILTGLVMAILLFVLVGGLPVVAQEPSPPTPLPQGEGSSAIVIQPVEASINDVPVEATLVAPDEQPPVVVIDQSQIPTWAVAIIITLVLGMLSIAYVGIVHSAKQAPEWVREVLLSAAHPVVEALGEYVETTPTQVDDIAYQELLKMYEQLRADILATSQKVDGIAGAGKLATDSSGAAILQPRKTLYGGDVPGQPPRDPASFLTGPDDGGFG